jgi:hypothetical protein
LHKLLWHYQGHHPGSGQGAAFLDQLVAVNGAEHDIRQRVEAQQGLGVNAEQAVMERGESYLAFGWFTQADASSGGG